MGRLTKTVQFKFDIVRKKMKFIVGGCTIRILSSIINISKKRSGTIVGLHVCSTHYNTCHMFRIMIRHGCYSALLASYLELPDRRVYMNTVPLYNCVDSGGFASLRAFLMNELSSPTDVKHADVATVTFAKVSAFTKYVSLNCCSFT